MSTEGRDRTLYGFFPSALRDHGSVSNPEKILGNKEQAETDAKIPPHRTYFGQAQALKEELTITFPAYLCCPTWEFLMIKARLRSHSMRGEMFPGNGAGALDFGAPSESPSSPSSGLGSIREVAAVGGFGEGRTSWRWSWSRLVSAVHLRFCRA